MRAPHRRAGLRIAALLAAVLALVAASLTATAVAEVLRDGSPAAVTAKPTIVLVHGAFADASGWNRVIVDLEQRGYLVYAPANPLRGLASDADYVRGFLATIPGPIVLVGHSYGGAVITNAARGVANVKALVYIAAYGLAEGESVQAANALGGGTTEVVNHLVLRPVPGGGQNADAYIDPAWFRQLFAPDVQPRLAAAMGAGQRPGALSTLVEPSGVPAWQSLPSWYLVAQNDRIIPPQAERVMAARMHAHTVEISSSHVPMISHASAATKLILTAAEATQ
jgi:pimeloyl-ACP methyl ester carboxylesterase